MQSRVFSIFFVTVLPAIIISQIEPQFLAGRSIFVRESSSKMYSQITFAISQLIAETPLNILCGFLFFLCFYFPVGFSLEASRAGYQFLTIIVVELFAVTLGQAVAALSPTVFIAVSFNPFLLVVFSYVLLPLDCCCPTLMPLFEGCSVESPSCQTSFQLLSEAGCTLSTPSALPQSAKDSRY